MTKKIEMLNGAGEVLHPQTQADCVILSSGTTVGFELGKDAEFTPVIAQDQSAFKVGTGIDVDYSANVKDGAYESLVFKGKSLVNVIGKVTVSNNATDNGNGSYTINKNTVYSRINVFGGNPMIKVNTPYYFTVVVSNGTLTDLNVDTGASVTKQQLESGKYLITLTEKSFNIAANRLFWYQSLSTTSEETVTIYPILVEYVEGMENWDIPYFEGICDVKMPILRNVGKNLLPCFTDNWIQRNVGGVTITDTSVYGTPTYGGFSLKTKIPLQSNVNYSCSASAAGSNLRVRIRTVEGEEIVHASVTNRVFSVDHDGVYYVTVENNGNTSENFSISKLMIEMLVESTARTTYEDHKTNILRTSEEVVLREVNGVKDTYNVITGEYVRRIGEITINGETHLSALTVNENTVKFAHPYTQMSEKAKPGAWAIADKMVFMKDNNNDIPHFRFDYATYGSPTFWVAKSMLETVDANGVRKYLTQNPVTIQYELAEPIITMVEPSVTPFAYANGHVILESGYDGYSLLPSLEYRAIVNQTGQLTRNDQVLQKHEKQMSSLESLLLNNLVETAYKRALLSFTVVTE